MPLRTFSSQAQRTERSVFNSYWELLQNKITALQEAARGSSRAGTSRAQRGSKSRGSTISRVSPSADSSADTPPWFSGTVAARPGDDLARPGRARPLERGALMVPLSFDAAHVLLGELGALLDRFNRTRSGLCASLREPFGVDHLRVIIPVAAGHRHRCRCFRCRLAVPLEVAVGAEAS